MRNMNMRTRGLAFAMCLLLISVTTAANGESLQWKFTQGGGWDVAMEQSIENTTLIRGKPVKMTVNMKIDMDWRVAKVFDDGSALMHQQAKRVRIRMESSGVEPVVYDSAKASDAEIPLGKAMSPFLKAKFEVRMAQDGAIAEADASLAKENKLPGVAAEDINRALMRATLKLPMKQLMKGDSWSVQSEHKKGKGKLAINTKYTYQGPVSDNADLSKISSTSQLTLEGAGKSRLKQQNQKGAIRFDHKRGFLVNSEVSQLLVTSAQRRGLVLETTTKSDVKVQLTPK